MVRENARQGRIMDRIGRRVRSVFRPRLDALEERALLSVFTVSNLSDGGPGSLRNAVNRANATTGADVIAFAPGLKGTISLTSGQLVITNSVSIQGPGASNLTIDAGHLSRVLWIASTGAKQVNATISGLTLADGLVTAPDAMNLVAAGADVLVTANTSATFKNVVVTRGIVAYGVPVNIQTQGLPIETGGGVAVLGGTASFVGGSVLGNVATGNNSLGGGIGVEFSGRLNLSGTSITDNTAEESSYGYLFGAYGGGIGAYRFGVVSMTGGDLAGNVVESTFARVPQPRGYVQLFTNFGGAAAIEGGSTASFLGVAFESNQANTGSGGAIFTGPLTTFSSLGTPANVFDVTPHLSVRDSTFTSNLASSDSAYAQNDSVDGSAIDNEGVMTIQGSKFLGNLTSLSGNYPGGGASGAVANSGSATISNSAFLGNLITDGTDSPLGSSGLAGAAIANDAKIGGGGLSHPTMTVSNSTFVGNQVNARAGDTVSGGAIESSFGGTITIAGSKVANNVIHGGFWVVGAGVANEGGTMILRDSTITNNAAISNKTDALAGALGGGVYSDTPPYNPPDAVGYFYPTTQLLNDTITGNSTQGSIANGGGGVFVTTSVGTTRDAATIIANNTSNGAPNDTNGTIPIT